MNTNDNNEIETPTGSENAPNVSLIDTPAGKVRALPLTDQDTGKVLKFKTDAQGLPVLDEQGKLQPDPKGKPVFAQVDQDGQPIFENDDLVYVPSVGKYPLQI